MEQNQETTPKSPEAPGTLPTPPAEEGPVQAVPDQAAAQPSSQGPKKKRPRRPGMGPNESMIQDFLDLVGNKSNPKDFVIISGLRMIDVSGSFDIKMKENPGKPPPSGVFIVHKKDLHKVIGDELASRFWNRRLHMRVPRKNTKAEAKKA